MITSSSETLLNHKKMFPYIIKSPFLKLDLDFEFPKYCQKCNPSNLKYNRIKKKKKIEILSWV